MLAQDQSRDLRGGHFQTLGNQAAKSNRIELRTQPNDLRRGQLQTIRSQIELYRVKNNGAYPALPFASFNGWGGPPAAGAAAITGGFIGKDYMRSEPMNPRTGTTTVVAGTMAASILVAVPGDDGWFWDTTLDEIYCNGLNEALDLWTPAP